MITGTVKWFNDEKGFGFLSAGDKQYFVHYREIQGTGRKTLHEGDRVEFTPTESPKGSKATDVRIVLKA